MIRVLHITTEHKIDVLEIEGVLEEFQRLVGGTIQGIYGYDWGGPDWCAFVDDNGKLDSRPQNVTAEILARSCGWTSLPDDFLVGDVVFVGPVDRNGNETSVPQRLIDLAPHARARAIAALGRPNAGSN